MRTQLIPVDVEYRVVLFNNLECDEYRQSKPFCEGSGWGDEEASVVCRNRNNSKHGFGGKQVANRVPQQCLLLKETIVYTKYMYIHTLRVFYLSIYIYTAYANVVSDGNVGYSHVNCTGDESGLIECTIGNLTSQTCTQAGIVHCLNGKLRRVYTTVCS